jgi:Ca-activated chloride channel homolog
VRPLRLSALISLSIGILWGGAAGLVPFSAAPAPRGQVERQYTIAIDVDLVVFNVAVTDSRGRRVSGLRPGDFRVFEENRLQTVTVFTAEDKPASIGLIIDNSGSMQSKRAEVINAALAFTGASNPEDELFVINFNEHVYMGLPPSMRFTSSPDQVRAALLGTAPAGMTALYDAMAVGIEHVKTGTRDRKALVVLSDGGDNASHHRLDDVIEIARRSSAAIYAIGIYDEVDADRNPGVLRKIAELSGGRAYFPSSSDLNRVWRDVAGEIRNQYTIGYHSSNPDRDGKYRKVKITASRNGRSLRVKTRDGYFAPAAESIAK